MIKSYEKLGEEINGLNFSKSWAQKHMDKANFQSDVNELKKLFNDQEQEELVEQIANELIDFIKACNSKLGGSDASQPS